MRDTLTKVLQRPGGFFSLMFIVLLVTATLFVPLVYSVDPDAISRYILAEPSANFPLGSDELGRDILQMLIYGIRVSLYVGFASAIVAAFLGVFFGAIAGFVGGKADLALMRVAELFQVLPTFVLAAVIVAMLGPGLTRVIGVIALLSWPQVALVVRGEVMRIRQVEYVDAVRCLGYDERYILLREVIPNALKPVITLAALIVGQAILTEASLSYLGLSSPDTISWGRMLNSGQRYLMSAWWLSVLPGIAVFLTVLAFNLLGDALNAVLNPGDRK